MTRVPVSVMASSSTMTGLQRLCDEVGKVCGTQANYRAHPTSSNTITDNNSSSAPPLPTEQTSTFETSCAFADFLQPHPFSHSPSPPSRFLFRFAFLSFPSLYFNSLFASTITIVISFLPSPPPIPIPSVSSLPPTPHPPNL